MARPRSTMKEAAKRGTKQARKRQQGERKQRKPVLKASRVKRLVFYGKRAKTSGGLTKRQLIMNKRGKIVSRTKHKIGKKRFMNIKPWVDSVVLARQQLKASGFVAINGTSVLGKRLYIRTKKLWKQSRPGGVVEAASTGDVKEEKSKEEVKPERQ